MNKNKLIKEIIKYLNEVNHNSFTDEELKEFTNDYLYMIENNDIEIIINTLQDEYNNSNDKRVLQLIKELEKINYKEVY